MFKAIFVQRWAKFVFLSSNKILVAVSFELPYTILLSALVKIHVYMYFFKSI